MYTRYMKVFFVPYALFLNSVPNYKCTLYFSRKLIHVAEEISRRDQINERQ